jgi:hypothetical protein
MGDQTDTAAIPTNLAVPSGHVMVFQALGHGVQIYVCEPKQDDAGPFEWTFRAPEADLLNASGEVVGRHFAGPTWEGNDGSQVVGEPHANAASPDPAAIPWLLLQARSNQGTGLFSSVTYVQRLNTTGGRAPAVGCDQAHRGQELRVPYTATYVFYYPSARTTR